MWLLGSLMILATKWKKPMTTKTDWKLLHGFVEVTQYILIELSQTLILVTHKKLSLSLIGIVKTMLSNVPRSCSSGMQVFLTPPAESSLTFLVVNKIFFLSEDEISWEHFRVYSRTILQIFRVLKKSLKLFKKILETCLKLISFVGYQMIEC